MSTPFFDYPHWLELQYFFSESNLELNQSHTLLTLVALLCRAGAPISGSYQECVQLNVWGFGPTQPYLSADDGMQAMIQYCQQLESIISKPEKWLPWARQNKAQREQFKRIIDVGQVIAKSHDGQITLTVRDQESKHWSIDLAANKNTLDAAVEALRQPRERSNMVIEVTINDVDLARGIVYTDKGPVRVDDPTKLSEAYDNIGRKATMWVDTAAPPMRVDFPELYKLIIDQQ